MGDPTRLAAIARFLEEVAVVDEPPSGLRRPIVILAALAAGATVAGVCIQTPATFLGAHLHLGPLDRLSIWAWPYPHSPEEIAQHIADCEEALQKCEKRRW